MPISDLRTTLGPAPAWLLFDGSPRAAAERGVVLFWHGFQSAKEDAERELHSLAAHGFLAVGLDAVGHGARRYPDFEARFAGQGDAFRRPLWDTIRATADETAAVLDDLLARGGARPDRLGAVGISMGACVGYVAGLAERRLGTLVAILGNPAWPEAGDGSPHAHADRFFPLALLSQVAGADGNVSPAGARELHARLGPSYAAAPERQRFVEHPGVGHFLPPADWERLWGLTLDWLDRFVGAPPPRR
jgi:uncharacterized protein